LCLLIPADCVRRYHAFKVSGASFRKGHLNVPTKTYTDLFRTQSGGFDRHQARWGFLAELLADTMCACTFCLDAKSRQKNQGKLEPSGLPIAIGIAGPAPPALVGLVKVKTLIFTCTKISSIYQSFLFFHILCLKLSAFNL
jgi:hypothetical protein